MTLAETKLISADELLAMGNIGRCELIYGELVMMSPAGVPHGMVAARFTQFLTAFVDQHNLGVVLAAETGFKIETNPDLVRAPDTSFIRGSKLIAGLPQGFFVGVPDLAVEVVSPDDAKRAVAEKVNMWLAHGTSVVWVADPRPMTVMIHHVGQAQQELTMSDEIKNEPLLPGFVLPLAKIFKRP